MEMPFDKVCIGIDPGANGAMVAYDYDSKVASSCRLNTTEADIWKWLCYFIGSKNCFACIEQQTPRPTFVPSLGKGTILASTCYLFGSYIQLRTMLLCGGIPFEDCPPKRWQGGLKIPHKEKGEKDTHWKNRLKSKAEQLFPRLTVTLANADALLLTEYIHRKRTGTL